MSVAAVLLVKDELDIIEHVLRHLAAEVDWVFVQDNGSTDGTLELVTSLDLPVTVTVDPDPAYYQDRKTTALAAGALAAGHAWVVPCDADEYWYATDGRTLSEFLGGLAPDTGFVRADMYNHLPTGLDAPQACSACRNTGVEHAPRLGDASVELEPRPCSVCGGRVEPNPFKRIGWRQREHGALPKVACRLRPGLEIHMGNHSAYAPGSAVTTSGFCIRHYSWRSAEQYLRKIRNGETAYAATDMPETTGAHWRMWQGKPDEAVVGHFHTWFHVEDPATRDDLMFDPAPFVDRQA